LALVMLNDCDGSLLSLPAPVLGRVWPAERGVMELRVCKQVWRDLIDHRTPAAQR